MRRAMRVVALMIGVLAMSLVAGACSSASDGAGDDAGGETFDADGRPVATIAEDDGPPSVPGAPLNPYDLRVGQCFNEGSWYDERLERRVDLTAAIDCDKPHVKEVYHEAEFPAPAGAPFPGEVKMTEWSTELCYEEFADFVGLEYELSIYEITFIQPTEDTFEHPVGRHRRVTCILYDRGGDELTGSAQDTAL